MRALVLSGGGSHGAWQAGSIRALEELGYTYDFIIGTSVGAVNAAGLAYGDASWVVDLWRSIKNTDEIMKIDVKNPVLMTGIYTLDPLTSLIKSLLSGKEMKVPAYAARTRLSDLTFLVDRLSHKFDDSDATVIAGSCALAGIHQPVDGHCDGGHIHQAPISAAKTMGATTVHAIICDRIAGPKPGWAPSALFPIMSNATRALEAMIDQGLRSDVAELEAGDLLLQPSRPHSVSSIEYTPSKIAAMIEQGYNETKETLSHGNSA